MPLIMQTLWSDSSQEQRLRKQLKAQDELLMKLKKESKESEYRTVSEIINKGIAQFFGDFSDTYVYKDECIFMYLHICTY